MPPMKKFYDCNITRFDGTVFNNPLTLSELHFIGQMARENKSVEVTVKTIEVWKYNLIFGK